MNISQLKAKLDDLISDADQQTQLHESSTQQLYKTLGAVYLWWREARRYEGFLEDLYSQRHLVQRGKEENFTRLVRLVWQIDWSGNQAPKLQNWAKSLRGLHHEYETNKDAYQVQEPTEKLRQFFNAMGGIGAVARTVSPLAQSDEEVASNAKNTPKPKKKSEIELLSEQQIRSKNVELGEIHFSNAEPIYKNIVSKQHRLVLDRKGYAVALVRRNSSGSLDLLSATSNPSIVQEAIVETYKRNDDAVPSTLRTLSEAIKTQALPLQLEKHRQVLSDPTEVVGADGKTRLRAIKRLLLRPKTKDILLSECRTDCSVVTIAKPIKFPSNLTEDTTLRAVNHKYIEQKMLQSRDLCFYTTKTKQIELLDDESIKASHRLKTKNTVTEQIHNLYFYPLTSHPEGSRKQADLNTSELGQPLWRATVDKVWIEDLQSICVENWLREFGPQLNRDRNKQVKFKLGKSFEISYDGTRGHYTKTESNIPKPKTERGSKELGLYFRSKDIFTVLNSLSQQATEGEVALAANEHVFTLTFRTNHASYIVAVPTCDDRGRLDRTAFKMYGA